MKLAFSTNACKRFRLEEIEYDQYLAFERYTHTADPQAAAQKSYAFLSRVFG